MLIQLQLELWSSKDYSLKTTSDIATAEAAKDRPLRFQNEDVGYVDEVRQTKGGAMQMHCKVESGSQLGKLLLSDQDFAWSVWLQVDARRHSQVIALHCSVQPTLTDGA